MSTSPNAALKYAEEHRNRFLKELQEILSIPSISVEQERKLDVQRGAKWVADRLRKAGMERVKIFETAGHPVVFAEIKSSVPSAKTILIYGHYDVQPADPLEAWESDPFQSTIRGENLYARGATDMKGQVMASLCALEAVNRTGQLPVNVKFLLEGEEELGSPHLGEFLDTHHDLLACDFSLNPDAGMVGADSPTIVYGLRGLFGCRLRITGPSRDLHSGAFGGIVYNPIHALSELIAGMHDEEGRVTLPGFYDKVRPLDPVERSEQAHLSRDEAYYLEKTGVPALWGETEFTFEERIFGRPTLDVVLFQAGHPKTAIPAEANAQITTRLVPDQSHKEVHQQLTQYLEKHTPPTVSWEILEWGGCPASLTDRNSIGVKGLSRALESIWGKKPVFIRGGGTIPVVAMLQEKLGVDSVMTGFSLPEDNMHGPNEKLHLPTWERGIKALIHFFHNLAG